MAVRDWHLETLWIFLGIAMIMAISAYSDHLERVDCRESGGILNEGKGCDPNVCRERAK